MKAVAVLLLVLSTLSPAAGQAHMPPGNPNYAPPPPAEGFSYPECYCTDSDGHRVGIGESACLRIGSRRVLARCDFSVNNPIWRPEAEGCPGV